MNTIRNIYSAHTLNRIVLSVISIYIPAFLLTHGFSLGKVLLFFTIYHVSGLLFSLFIFPPLARRFGVMNTFKLYYPLQILYLLSLSFFLSHGVFLEVVAIIGGFANFAYWTSMNIFFIKFAKPTDMGNSLAKFFALPQLFGIVGPLLGAVLIPSFGFWPIFLLTIVGLLLSFMPLLSVDDSKMHVGLHFSHALKRFSRSKLLFLFEFLDNIIEESEWFWSIYVFLLIGSLAVPGIVGSLESVGGALFTLFIGKYASRYGRKVIPFASICFIVLMLLRIVINTPISAYIITLIASFVLTLFLVSYFSSVYKTVKDDKEEEFMILREIPTVLGRLVVFGFAYLTIHDLRLFFLLPLATVSSLLLLYMWKGKQTFEAK